MKKMISILLALTMAAACTSSLAEEAAQPEEGKKFEGNWALMGGLTEISYEEEGYRVSVDLFDQGENKGVYWEYSCFYNREKDALLSVSSCKSEYTQDPATLDRTYGEYLYSGLDEEGQTTEFAIDENGMLTWTDPHENAGADLEFRSIGSFAGPWADKSGDIWADISWEGLQDEETFCYRVLLHLAEGEDMELFGLTDPDTGVLEVSGTDARGKEFSASFAALENGGILLDIGGGIVLEYDLSSNNG